MVHKVTKQNWFNDFVILRYLSQYLSVSLWLSKYKVSEVSSIQEGYTIFVENHKWKTNSSKKSCNNLLVEVEFLKNMLYVCG